MPVTIARGESWRFEWKLEQHDESTGALEPLAVDTAVTAWLSATFKGDPIAGCPVTTLARGALVLREDGRALWSGVLAAADVTGALAAIATNDPVYEVCEISAERKSQQLTVAD